MTNFLNKYSTIDRSLHYLAFNSTSAQISLSNLEDKIYKKKLEGIEVKNPVFVTALPRAGTTLLLELLASTSEFVSNTYRDMPFFLTPLFWDKYSRLFKQSDIPRERAHGDGMMVSVDSPEAFEEIIWKSFWQSRYRNDRIIPWSSVNYPEFESFFKNHIRKTVFLKSTNDEYKGRYISKNNLNIARLEYLNKIFPDSIILVLFRHPLQHALSLLRQHLNFLKIHEDDVFASKYMEAIGHYDFGKNIKPVDFDKWLSPELLMGTKMLVFWLQYWTNTYRYLLKHSPANTKFISFESLCASPAANLEKLGELLGVRNNQELISQSGRIVLPKPHVVDIGSLNPDVLQEAQDLYESLNEASFLH